jgi:hypothetical protein
LTLAVQRSDSIPGYVQQSLNQHRLVCMDIRQAWIVIGDKANGFRFGLQQLANVLENLVDVEQLLDGQIFGPKHPVYQILQPVGFSYDDAGKLLAFFIELPVQQLGSAADAAQGILDLVCKSAQQASGGFLLMQ